jgi:hypothetical protein
LDRRFEALAISAAIVENAKQKPTPDTHELLLQRGLDGTVQDGLPVTGLADCRAALPLDRHVDDAVYESEIVA